MWQRVQTLYLAIATALVAVLFFSNVATVNGPDGLDGIRYIDKTAYLCLLIPIALANLLALIAFKVRILQMRVSIIGALLLIGLQVWLVVDYFNAPDGLVFSYTAVFPIVAAILDILAARGAFMDQAMVESAYRLRDYHKRQRKGR